VSDIQSFLGTGWTFPPTFLKNGKNGVKMSSGEKGIRESIHVLLSTTMGERFMEPKFGVNLANVLFEPLTLTLETYIEDLVRDAIIRYEPRIVLERVLLESRPEEGTLLISLQYTVATENNRYNYVFPYYVTEASNLNP
jgi:uncharacterized protein